MNWFHMVRSLAQYSTWADEANLAEFGLRKTNHYPLAQVTLMFLQVCFSKKKKKNGGKRL